MLVIASESIQCCEEYCLSSFVTFRPSYSYSSYSIVTAVYDIIDGGTSQM